MRAYRRVLVRISNHSIAAPATDGPDQRPDAPRPVAAKRLLQWVCRYGTGASVGERQQANNLFSEKPAFGSVEVGNCT